MRTGWLSSLAVVCVVLVASVAAKGATVRLTVDGSTLSEPLDILDARLLASSNVFAGGFLGARHNEPPRLYPRYQVTFYVESPGWMKRPIAPGYVLTYVKDPLTGQGFIHLPGRGDPGYRVNVGTVMRDGLDGTWLLASPEWSRAINRFLP